MPKFGIRHILEGSFRCWQIVSQFALAIGRLNRTQFGAIIEIWRWCQKKLAFANWVVSSYRLVSEQLMKFTAVPKRCDVNLHLQTGWSDRVKRFGAIVEIWWLCQNVEMQVFCIWELLRSHSIVLEELLKFDGGYKSLRCKSFAFENLVRQWIFFFLRWLRHAMGKARQDLSKAHPAFFTKYMMKTKFGSIWHFYCDHEIQGAIMKSWELMRG